MIYDWIFVKSSRRCAQQLAVSNCAWLSSLLNAERREGVEGRKERKDRKKEVKDECTKEVIAR
jgi:hypothetical protein